MGEVNEEEITTIDHWPENKDVSPAKVTAEEQAAPPTREGAPSTGGWDSTAHNAGACRPSAWGWRQSGRWNGVACHFSHSCEEGELKRRRKMKVQAMRSATPRLHLVDVDDGFAPKMLARA
jgi:hypothetical protein